MPPLTMNDNIPVAISTCCSSEPTSRSQRRSRRRERERTKKREETKKSVRFNRYDEVFDIPHIKDLSKQEILDVWMTNEDIRDIQTECIGAVSMVGKGSVSNGFLLRGLDQHTLKYKEERDVIKDQVYDAVFSIQEFQRVTGTDVSELICAMCEKRSEAAVVAAQIAAISDVFSSFKDTWSQRTIPVIVQDAQKVHVHVSGDSAARSP
jgi:hypothetical protein